MRRFTYLIAIVFTFSLINCGADLLEEGKKAYAAGDYTEAINLLTKAQKENPIDHSFDYMICLAYIYRGEELYKTTRNLKAFNGNFEKANNFLPINPTNEFNKEYASLLITLAKAYHSAKSKSEDEKELYYENAFNRVKQAKALDSTNTAADSILAQLKVDNFQKLVDKGEGLYKKAGRSGNADLYFMAEYYLKEAREFEPHNKKINNLLNKIVQKTLPVLNYREGVSLAVAGYSGERKAIIMTLSIKNYTAKAISLKLDNFKLVDTEGNSYDVNESEMRKKELFGETCVKSTVLNQDNPSAEGIIAFTAPKDIKIAYVNYQISNNKFARKYFP